MDLLSERKQSRSEWLGSLSFPGRNKRFAFSLRGGAEVLEICHGTCIHVCAETFTMGKQEQLVGCEQDGHKSMGQSIASAKPPPGFTLPWHFEGSPPVSLQSAEQGQPLHLPGGPRDVVFTSTPLSLVTLSLSSFQAQPRRLSPGCWRGVLSLGAGGGWLWQCTLLCLFSGCAAGGRSHPCLSLGTALLRAGGLLDGVLSPASYRRGAGGRGGGEV